METVDNSAKVKTAKLVVVPILVASGVGVMPHLGLHVPRMYTRVLDAAKASLD